VFATLGFTNATFAAGSMANGVPVDDNDLPYTPDYTASFGGQMTRPITSTISGFVRAEVVLTGAFSYDESNSQGQDAYSLVNLRAGARVKRFFADVWLRNAFDTSYVPIAIPYPGFAPSGFIGENGRPRTFGITIGTMF
jgi:iron complex outermembrane recepter protein